MNRRCSLSGTSTRLVLCQHCMMQWRSDRKVSVLKIARKKIRFHREERVLQLLLGKGGGHSGPINLLQNNVFLTLFASLTFRHVQLYLLNYQAVQHIPVSPTNYFLHRIFFINIFFRQYGHSGQASEADPRPYLDPDPPLQHFHTGLG